MKNLFKKFKNEINRIEVPEKRLDKAFQTAMNSEKPKRSIQNKIASVMGATALFIGLLLGSASMSPTMADTIAKIPVIGSVFQLGDPGQEITDDLKEKGFKIHSLSFQYQPEKVVEIEVDGSKEYLNDVSSKVKSIAKNTLQSQDYNAYTVDVSRPGNQQLSEQTKSMNETLQKIRTALKKNDFSTKDTGVRYYEGTVEVWVSGSNKHFSSIKEDIKNIVTKTLNSEDAKYNNLKITQTDEPLVEFTSVEDMPKNKQKWVKSGVLPVISSELYGKKDYHVKGIATKLDNGTMQWGITIKLESTDSSANKVAKGIKENITKILESDRFESEIGALPYKVTIYDQDKKVIN